LPLPSNSANRVEAQQRADRIIAFQQELAQLEGDQTLTLTGAQREQLHRYHRNLLDQLAAQFDVDTTHAQRQMSWGMRIASLLGALALAASVVFLFYRVWGLMPTAVQVFVLIAAPSMALVGVDIGARRERTLYFTTLVALVAFAGFFLNLSVLGDIFNITPSPNPFLVWAGLALVVAYGYGLRLLLVAGILCLLGFLSAKVGVWCGLYWLSFGERPENFIPAGLILFAIPSFFAHHRYPDFPGYYRLFGLLTVLTAILVLSHSGWASYFLLHSDTVEAIYQSIGFLAAGLTIWLGIRFDWSGVTSLGTTFFVIQLYTKFFDWWWDWMPKYLFFLLLGLVAIGLLSVFKRLRMQLTEAQA
jgi:uncharacterized membrane protein